MDNWPVKRFKISRLYGYKDVEIQFKSNVLILVAGNGSGKTTILNALHAFLRGRFTSLWSLNFESIECEFSSSGETVEVTKDLAISSRNAGLSERLESLVERTPYTAEDLYEYLATIFKPEDGSFLWRTNNLAEAIYRNTPYDFDEIEEHFKQLHSMIHGQLDGQLKDIWTRIQHATHNIEVVYLPTYRRIENPLLSPKGRRRRARPGLRRVPGENTYLRDGSHMNYGLEDVEARLDELSGEVEKISNAEYRSASATIIDDALANAIAPSSFDISGLPEFDALARFLLRVSRADRSLRDLPMTVEAEQNSKGRIEALRELYDSGRIADPNQWVLRYFLSRLGSVIEKTQETEAMLQRFVEACNGYLVESSDEKKFVYEPNSMRVTVVNSFTESVVPLSQLSSGEKQIVSILAKLYLYNSRNFILIDEPELSLSLDWQRRILPDMMKSGSVAQLLAITHSPFVFENELDPFAGPMTVTRHRVGA